MASQFSLQWTITTWMFLLSQRYFMFEPNSSVPSYLTPTMNWQAIQMTPESMAMEISLTVKMPSGSTEPNAYKISYRFAKWSDIVKIPQWTPPRIKFRFFRAISSQTGSEVFKQLSIGNGDRKWRPEMKSSNFKFKLNKNRMKSWTMKPNCLFIRHVWYFLLI